jgi:hypothetical protein
MGRWADFKSWVRDIAPEGVVKAYRSLNKPIIKQQTPVAAVVQTPTPEVFKLQPVKDALNNAISVAAISGMNYNVISTNEFKQMQLSSILKTNYNLTITNKSSLLSVYPRKYKTSEACKVTLKRLEGLGISIDQGIAKGIVLPKIPESEYPWGVYSVSGTLGRTGEGISVAGEYITRSYLTIFPHPNPTDHFATFDIARWKAEYQLDPAHKGEDFSDARLNDLALRKQEAGEVLYYPYWDRVQFSIGYGCGWLADGVPVRWTTNAITAKKADALFEINLAMIERYLSAVLPNIEYTQNQYDALVIATYNYGPQGLVNAIILPAAISYVQGVAPLDYVKEYWHGNDRRDLEFNIFAGKLSQASNYTTA